MEGDLEGITRLLRQLFLKEPINLVELSQLLYDQKNIGSILRQFENEDSLIDKVNDDENEELEDETLAIFSCVDLIKNKDHQCIKSFHNYLMKNLKGNERQKMEALLNSDQSKVWVINERFINLSWRLAVPSYEQLCKEMEQNRMRFDYFILICKILYPKRKLKEAKRQRQVKEEVIFLNAEDEIFNSKSDEYFEFSVAHQCDADPRGGDWGEDDQQFVPYRRILILKAKSWFDAINELKQIN